MKKLFLLLLLSSSLSLLAAQSLTISELKENLEISLSLSQKLNRQLNFLEMELDNKNQLLESLESDNLILNSQLKILKEQSQSQTTLLETLQKANQQLTEQSEQLEEQLNSSKILCESLSEELKTTKKNSLSNVLVFSVLGLLCGGLIGHFLI